MKTVPTTIFRLRERGAAFAFALMVGCGLGAAPADANMQVTPLIIEAPNAPGTSGIFQTRNSAIDGLPVEVTVARREIGPDGSVRLVPADDDFVIFPPQAIVPPRQAQTFRFQYLGGADPATSASYYFYVSQLPVDLEDDAQDDGALRARLSFLYQYGISVNLVPDGAQPALTVRNATPTVLPGGTPGVRLTVANLGNRFARASEHELTIRSGGGTTVFDRETLKKGLNNGMWLPGQSLDISFPVNAPPGGPVQATFNYVGG